MSSGLANCMKKWKEKEKLPTECGKTIFLETKKETKECNATYSSNNIVRYLNLTFVRII